MAALAPQRTLSSRGTHLTNSIAVLLQPQNQRIQYHQRFLPLRNRQCRCASISASSSIPNSSASNNSSSSSSSSSSNNGSSTSASPLAPTPTSTPSTNPAPPPVKTLTYAQIIALEEQDRAQRAAYASNHPPRPQPGSTRADKIWAATTAGLLLAIVPITYYYYQHRQEQMARKREGLRAQAGERRQRELAAEAASAQR